MQKILSINLAFMISIALIGCNLDPSDSNKIEKMKSIIKESLIDGESAQLSDLKYYKLTNFGCGYVNAKNKMGGYVGKKKFIVSLEKNLAAIDPDRETPEPPSAPTYTTIESTMRYATQSAEWSSKVDAIRSEYMAFDALVAEKCTDTPPKIEEKKEANKKEPVENKVQFVPYEEKDGFIAQYSEAYPFYAVNLSKALAPNLIKILQPKGPTETSTEFSKRSSYLGLEPKAVDLNVDYGLVLLDNEMDDYAVMKGVVVKYDADTEKVSVLTRGSSFSSVCNDPAREAYSSIPKGKEYGITCKFNRFTKIIVSNKQTDFSKYFKRDSVLESYVNIKDSFKLSRQKITALPTTRTYAGENQFRVGMMIVGRVNKNLTISNFADETGSYEAGATPDIPFTINKIVYFNTKNGEILASRLIK